MSNSFEKYHKIYRIEKSENQGILDGLCHIQEKIDGANASIWMSDGKIKLGSRNRDLEEGSFNGFKEYVKKHEGINKFFENFPDGRLCGEWLVKHTVKYHEDSYRKFYLFDIKHGEDFIHLDTVYSIGKELKIEMPQLFLSKVDPTIEEIKEYVGKSCLGDTGEGVVIKNLDFVNKYGETTYAKIVTENFKEESSIAFGGNDKHAEGYHEMYVVNKYVNTARVQKMMHKIKPTLDEELDMKHIPQITGCIYHDILTECIWDIQKKVPVLDFKRLSRLCMKKSKAIYVELLQK